MKTTRILDETKSKQIRGYVTAVSPRQQKIIQTDLAMSWYFNRVANSCYNFQLFFFSYIYQYCIFKGRSLRFIILGCHCFVITHVSDVILLSSCEFSLSKLLSDSLGGYKIYAFDLLIKQRYRMPSLYPLL